MVCSLDLIFYLELYRSSYDGARFRFARLEVVGSSTRSRVRRINFDVHKMQVEPQESLKWDKAPRTDWFFRAPSQGSVRINGLAIHSRLRRQGSRVSQDVSRSDERSTKNKAVETHVNLRVWRQRELCKLGFLLVNSLKWNGLLTSELQDQLLTIRRDAGHWLELCFQLSDSPRGCDATLRGCVLRGYLEGKVPCGLHAHLGGVASRQDLILVVVANLGCW